jgi:hypothetical protein
MRIITSRSSGPVVATEAVGIAMFGALVGGPFAQAPVHLNPMIETLALGEVAFGASNEDMSLQNARALATADLDWMYIDYEHAPMNFETLQLFLLGMVDKAEAVRKGSPQPNVAPLARFAPYAREGSEWVIKQGLDQGLMGIIFNSVGTPEQARRNVRAMRYPQRRGSALMEPLGLRGSDRDHDGRNGRGPEERERDRGRAWCGWFLHRAERALALARRGPGFSGDGGGDSDGARGLSRAQRAVRHHRGRSRHAAPGRSWLPHTRRRRSCWRLVRADRRRDPRGACSSQLPVVS